MSKEIYQPEQPEKNNPFSEADLAKWTEGAGRYRLFVEEIGDISRYYSPRVGEVQALFLGEKPAVVANEFALDNRTVLEKLGFRFSGDYCYSEEAVQKAIDEHKDIFSSFPDLSPEAVIQELRKTSYLELHIAGGIILGIPEAAAKAFQEVLQPEVNDIIDKLIKLLPQEEAEYLYDNYFRQDMCGNQKLLKFIIRKLETGIHRYKLGLNRKKDVEGFKARLERVINSKSVDIHGIGWADYEPSEESEQKQKRLKAAFEKSGILL